MEEDEGTGRIAFVVNTWLRQRDKGNQSLSILNLPDGTLTPGRGGRNASRRFSAPICPTGQAVDQSFYANG